MDYDENDKRIRTYHVLNRDTLEYEFYEKETDRPLEILRVDRIDNGRRYGANSKRRRIADTVNTYFKRK